MDNLSEMVGNDPVSLIGKVEWILNRIELDRGAQYVGAERVTSSGVAYIDAATFILRREDGTQARFSVCGRECQEGNDESILEDLIRVKARFAVNCSA